ncbi:MAG: methylmalonyl Co-A mutase-associated GTPase MeaB [Planctomycetes bacterium]|nr:methylmalonyl Co-A mutase-associated GTPase MeaB [Planctomycetota bacterium]
MIERLIERFRHGDRLALARLMSLAARGELPRDTLGALQSSKPARVVAITGSGGVGKSSLVGRLITVVRDQGLKVAVLACDPQSPLSGGALLGDRVRMAGKPDDDGVFIRSLAALSGQSALAAHLDTMIRLCEAFGMEVVLIETAGAGQGDTAVHALADVVVLLLQPETGDDLQREKAGVFEVADVLVVHKADMPGAEQAFAQVRAAAELATPPVPVLKASARTGEGLAELWRLVAGRPLRRQADQVDKDLLVAIQEELARRFESALAGGVKGVRDLVSRWRQGSVSSHEAATAVLDLLLNEP